jgi:hypothetical protein
LSGTTEHEHRKRAAHHVTGKDGRNCYPGGLPASGGVYFFREGWNPSGTRFVAFIKDPANNLFEAYSMTANGTDVRYLYHISITTQAIIPGAMTIT